MANYGSYAPYGPLAAERTQHIEDMLRHYPTAKAINPDRSVWDLPLELRDRKTTALRISLTPHFPQERPILSVLIPVAHPIVDSTGRVHTPQLTSWAYGSSKLVTVVAEAVAALSAGVVSDNRNMGVPGTVPYPAGYPGGPSYRPAGSAGNLNAAGPGPASSGPGSAGGAASPKVNGIISGGGGSSSSLSNMAGASGGSVSLMSGPATSSRLPDFSRYSTEQLEQLLHDEAKFKELLREAVLGSAMSSTLEDIRVKNRQLAEANMGKQEAINEVRNQLAVVRSSEYTLIKARFDELLQRQRKVTGALSPLLWKEKLEDAVSEADAASGTLASSFLAGEALLEDFLRQYVEVRTRHHVLDLKRQAAEHLLTAPAASGGG